VHLGLATAFLGGYRGGALPSTTSCRRDTEGARSLESHVSMGREFHPCSCSSDAVSEGDSKPRSVVLDSGWSELRFTVESDGSRSKHLKRGRPPVVRMGPRAATIGPVVSLEFERVEALELLGMVLAHLSIAETRSELSPRVPLLMGIRDKLAEALREEQ
jgi:hypothetical protein